MKRKVAAFWVLCRVFWEARQDGACEGPKLQRQPVGLQSSALTSACSLLA